MDSSKKALDKIIAENRKSLSKGFNAVNPRNYSELDISPVRAHYPEFTLPLKSIPEAKKWEVGCRYNLEIVVEQVAVNDRIGQESNVSFSVIGVKAGEKVSKGKSGEKEKVENNSEDEEDYDE